MPCVISDNKRGFTIIEIMASVALLAIGMAALASMQVLGIKGNIGGEERSVAAALVASKIQEFSAMEYEINSSTGVINVDPALDAVVMTTPVVLNSNGLTSTEMSTKYGAGGDNANDFRYNMSWIIEDVGDQTGPGSYKNITITVSWFDRSTKGVNDLVNPSIVVTTFPLVPKY